MKEESILLKKRLSPDWITALTKICDTIRDQAKKIVLLADESRQKREIINTLQSLIIEQDRKRGYPTGSEWTEIVKKAKAITKGNENER